MSQRADKFLQKLDSQLRDRILSRLKRLAENAIPTDAKFIGRDNSDKIFRYRIGDYRALYRVNYQEKRIIIVEIDKRARAY